MANKVYLRVGDDTLDEVTEYSSIRSAALAFQREAEDLARFDQPLEASLHFAPSKDEVVEYPDRVLSLGPRGGLRIENT